ncbi:TetR/AcrR family transcriptional regulator [Kocuria sabuli]|uniref:TetR/AcrR family transcriptional regulator n=1 Tax=Kocuria sabuli TaxID=3071448 RepID=UPI0034D6A6FB
MPEDTRERILEAVVRVLVEQGVDRVRVRAVAQEAGVSVGAVQHSYPTRSRLVHAAMDHVSARITAGLLEQIDLTKPAQENLLAACRMLAGVEDAARPAAVVWLAFTSLACTDPVIAAAHRSAWQTLEDALARLLAQVNPATTADDAAELLALLDGLAIARATEPGRMTAARAAAIVTGHVRRLAGRSPH